MAPLVWVLFVGLFDSLQVTSELVTTESLETVQEREIEVEDMEITLTVG